MRTRIGISCLDLLVTPASCKIRRDANDSMALCRIRKILLGIEVVDLIALSAAGKPGFPVFPVVQVIIPAITRLPD